MSARGHSWSVVYNLRGRRNLVHIWAADLEAAKRKAWSLYFWAYRLELRDATGNVHIITSAPS